MSLSDDVAAYSMATSQFLHDATIVDDDNLDRRVEGGWSARQVIHHIADSEALSFATAASVENRPPCCLVQAARKVSSCAASRRHFMSAIFCWIIWNDPIDWPNALRSRA